MCACSTHDPEAVVITIGIALDASHRLGTWTDK